MNPIARSFLSARSLAITAAALAAGCSDPTNPTENPPPHPSGSPPPGSPPADASVTTVSVLPARAGFLPGGSFALTAVTRDPGGYPLTGHVVRWASSNLAVASVDSTSGVVKAVAVGRATISATSEGQTGTAAIAVVASHGAFRTISAGGQHTCALTSAGQAYCWGLNTEGQLGNGTTTSSPLPGPVAGGITFASISAGENVTCGLDPDGAAYCWGQGAGGLLGNGSASGSTDVHPTPVRVLGGLAFSTLSVEPPCGITRQGVGYCWGGRQGDGTWGDTPEGRSPIPVPIAGGLTLSAVTTSRLVACVLTTTGAAYCWGDNLVAELGIGSTSFDPSTVPLPVAGGLKFTALGTGWFGSCGLVGGGAAYCWGDNTSFCAWREVDRGTVPVERRPARERSVQLGAGASQWRTELQHSHSRGRPQLRPNRGPPSLLLGRQLRRGVGQR